VKPRPDGSVDLTVLIDKVVADKMQTPGSRTNRALRQRGLPPGVTSRGQ
jgi:hypothetical protein